MRGKVRECVIPPPEESTSVWLTEEPLLQIISFHYNLLLIIAKKMFSVLECSYCIFSNSPEFSTHTIISFSENNHDMPPF